MQYIEHYDNFFNVLNTKQQDLLSKSLNIFNSNLLLDYQSDININNSIFVVGNTDMALDFINVYKDKFNIKTSPFIESFSGSLGNFKIIVDDEIIDASIIIFFIDFAILKPQLGVLFINDYDSKEHIANEIENLIGDFIFDKSILYFEDKCQYHHRDKTNYSYCRSCVDICPNMSISSNEYKKELIFSDIDCIMCGKCVGVCPSGAMQKTSASITSVNKALKIYKDKMLILIGYNDLKDSIDLFNNILSKYDIFPFIVPNVNILNEVYLLSILQESARRCLIFGKSSQILDESIKYINALYKIMFNTDAIYHLDSIDKLDMDVIDTSPILGYTYDVDQREFSREIFANRMKFFIKNNDFGILKNTDMILYTNLDIDDKSCTLCMSCVDACNANALISSKDNFSLLLNPSLCTVCGFCLDICPEKVISMPLLGYELNDSFLNYNVKAKDEAFACIECGKIFASAKSIEKVKSIMMPIFVNDETKMKTIFCCSDCKVKVMFNRE